MRLPRRLIRTLTDFRQQILSCLPPEYPWGDHISCFDTLDSTNDRLKALARQGAPEGTAIFADQQTGGHGRLGRSFHSPAGMGIYLSLLLRPVCAPQDLMHLTCAVAVAMADAVEAAAGFRPGIKWTNDLVFGKRKLGGILTELGLSPRGQLDYAILGIGINCCQKSQDFPPELKSIAGSLAMVARKPIDRARAAAAMLSALHRMNTCLLTGQADMLAQYRRDCVTLGKDISLLRGDFVRHGYALDVDDAGALVVRYEDGQLEHVSSGEVSVRGMYGYL